jgi:hypothetical protein
MTEENQDHQLNIELSEEVAEGSYSNLVIISHSNAEFVLDFIRILPGLPKAKVRSRIIMTPMHTKRLLFALQDNLHKFESHYGHIDIKDGDGPLPPMGFSGPAGLA